MNHLKKLVKILVVSLVLIVGFVANTSNNSYIFAAGVSVSASNNGNGTYSVSVASSLTGAVSISTSNGGTGLYWCEGGACNLQSGASSFEGQDSITVTATPSNPMDDGDGNKVTAQGSSTTVNVTNGSSGGSGGSNTASNKQDTKNEEKEENENKDKNSSLSALSISAGKLSPVFSATTTSYRVALPSETTEFEVTASASSEKASVSGTGKIALQAGDNSIEVVCTAEDGSATAYIINAMVSEKPITQVKFNDQKFGVLNGSIEVNKLFTKTTIKINGKEVDAWVNTSLNMTLLYLQDEKTNEKNLYFYDTKKNMVTSIYKPFTYAGKNLAEVSIPKDLQKRKGMVYTTVTLGQYTLPGWTFREKAFKDYSLIYVMDETGKFVYYQYDKKEDTLQHYSGAAAIGQKEYENYVRKMENQRNLLLIVVLALGLLSIVLFIITLVIYRKKKKPLKFQKVNIKNTPLKEDIKIEVEALMHEKTDE